MYFLLPRDGGFRDTNLKYSEVKKTLERCKNKVYPPVKHLPEEILELFTNEAVMRDYGHTLEGEAVMYVGGEVEPRAFIVFKSQYVIDYIEANIPRGERYYLMDGTFDSLPKEFYQLVIIAIEIANDVSTFARSSVRTKRIITEIVLIIFSDIPCSLRINDYERLPHL